MKYYAVDAFTDKLFHGNPAGVCLLDGDSWLEDSLLLQIAAEINLPETAFLLLQPGGFGIRYFSPAYEVPLCGHATLASSLVVHQFVEPNCRQIRFFSQSGVLAIIPTDSGFYEMDLPARPVKPIPIDPQLERAVGCKILEAYQWEKDVFVVIGDAAYLQQMQMDFSVLNRIPGILNCCVTAPLSGEYDFASRLFSPNYVIPEDPVCGSAHCALTTLWAQKLGKNSFLARQVSPRGGIIQCNYDGDRVKIAGNATLYLKGEIKLTGRSD